MRYKCIILAILNFSYIISIYHILLSFTRVISRYQDEIDVTLSCFFSSLTKHREYGTDRFRVGQHRNAFR